MRSRAPESWLDGQRSVLLDGPEAAYGTNQCATGRGAAGEPSRASAGTPAMRRLCAVAIGLLVAACAAPAPSMPDPSSAPATASDADGRYSLVFTLPKSTYADREEITGLATFTLEPGPDVVVGGSRDLLSFGFAEVGGSREMGPASDAMCARHELSASTPLTSRIVKSGGWSDDMPDADFYSGFFADPAVRLPAGDWDITAYADLVDGAGCAGAQHGLKATVRVHVAGAPSPNP